MKLTERLRSMYQNSAPKDINGVEETGTPKVVVDSQIRTMTARLEAEASRHVNTVRFHSAIVAPEVKEYFKSEGFITFENSLVFVVRIPDLDLEG